jgi:hypothetical protein
MEDILGMGQMIKNEGASAVCTKSASAGATTSALCDRIDCPSYGKWYCPFTGW